jgi:hypothetical protein
MMEEAERQGTRRLYKIMAVIQILALAVLVLAAYSVGG